ncbi:MAG: M14 metallopeptidase family protein [Candidatus Eisenbacteria bacterium]
MNRTLPRFVARLAVFAACALAPAAAPAATLPTPSEYLHLDIGADRVLADYRQIRSYFGELDRLSPRVQVQTLGRSTLGEDMIMAVITSEANMARLPRLKEIAAKLADPRGLTDAQVAALAEEGRAFLLITCNIHATEIGSTQMAMEWAHALASAEDAETRRRLDEVVLLLVPSLNPDGQIMETEWYGKYLGTPYEGGREPWLYHHYTGHDNNRDWFMLTQAETKAMSRAVYHEWFPQVWLDEHQMGNNGPRIFTPPYAEPVDADIHPLVWREVNRMGADMSLRLEQANKSGVIYGYAFDAYWPGGTKNTAWFKNISGLLTEVASVKLATPVYVDPSELAGGRKGLVDYERQTNFPNPWPGGWWRLRDIMDYERIASDAILESSADLRRDLLRNMAVRARASIALGEHGEGFLLPRAAQHDWAGALKLADLLVEHGVEVFRAGDDLWVPLAQPYGNFAREMLTTQRYPEVKLVPGKDIVRPYDVAAWSLPLMMGVTVQAATNVARGAAYTPGPRTEAAPVGAVALAPTGAERARALNAALRSGGRVTVLDRATTLDGRAFAAGTALLDTKAAAAAAAAAPAGLAFAPAGAAFAGRALTAPRVALYKPWAASMDEGWTRFLLERYGFAPRTLDNATIQKGNLRASFDAIVLPDVPKEVIATGKPKREDGGAYFVELPPEYRGGLDAAGAAALKEFVKAGGTLVALAGACDYVTEQFNIPVSNALARVTPADFGCPGSILRAHVNGDHPVTWGMPPEAALFVDKPIAFATQPPAGELDRAVLATYPDDPRDVLLSGWITGEDKLVRRSAAVAVTMGKGKLVLFGFRPQHRAQTDGTHPLLFNALWWSALAD